MSGVFLSPLRSQETLPPYSKTTSENPIITQLQVPPPQIQPQPSLLSRIKKQIKRFKWYPWLGGLLLLVIVGAIIASFVCLIIFVSKRNHHAEPRRIFTSVQNFVGQHTRMRCTQSVYGTAKNMKDADYSNTTVCFDNGGYTNPDCFTMKSQQRSRFSCSLQLDEHPNN